MHAQVCVDPAGGGCETTIQAGVDVALAGETVTVAAATYTETVTIPAGKDGLTISAKKAVLDNPSIMDGIIVLSNNVTISGLTIRNGATGVILGESLGIDVSGIRLTKMTFEAQDFDAIEIYGSDSVTVEKSTFASCGNRCVQGGDFHEPDPANNLTLTKNRFNICDGSCVEVDGNAVTATSNRCTSGEDGHCIQISGDNAVVVKNRGSNTDGLVRIDGENPRVVGNKIRYSGGEAFTIACEGNCAAGAIVAGNSVRDSSDNSRGFWVYADAPGLVVSGNTSMNAADHGFDINGTGVIVENNVAFATGGDASSNGFSVSGADHVLRNNVAFESANDGFALDFADNVTLEGNLSRSSFGDGFSVGISSENVTLTNNTADDNVGEGFELFSPDDIDPVTATLTGNTSTGNRTPFCVTVVTGGPVDGGSNSFTVPGAPACEVNQN